MLTVAKVGAGAAGGYADYLDGRSRPSVLGDYYLKEGERVEAPGRWAAGAVAVGADPEAAVSGEMLRALMAVRRPDNGMPLRRVGANGQAVAAIDATFSAPKSVSAVWALASPGLRERVERAHEHAIDMALAYATRLVPMIRERVDRETLVRVVPEALVATSWRHTTARAVDGRPPDPQLHSHVLLHGAVRRDGRIVAIESRAWLVHRRELGAAYRTELAHELAELGFAIKRATGRGGRYFEIEGVPSRLIDRWSSRHHQVTEAIDARLRAKHEALEAIIAAGGQDAQRASARLEELRHAPRLAPAEDRYMTASTRTTKPRLATRGDLDRHWSQTGSSLGFDPPGVERLRTGKQSLEPAMARELLGRLTEFDATFADREARAVALEASAGATVGESLVTLDQLRWNGELLALADGRETTRAHRRAERETVALAEQVAAARVTTIPQRLIEHHARALDAELRTNGARLAAEQRQALELACSDRQLVLIEGQAGTGKSTVLAGVARAHQADGQQIVVTSTAAIAAERLASELVAGGVHARSYSTAALQTAITARLVTLAGDVTVIHDEAALASTREQHRLLSAVQASGARLIEVGDPGQSQSVGAGGLWPHLQRATRANQAHVELTRNIRAQDHADRRDQKLFRDGYHEQALRNYASRGRVILAADQRSAEDGALEDAQADRQADKTTLVIAQTSNEHLDELNARAQAIRAQHNELGDRGLAVAGRPYRLHAGDEIQIRRSIHHPDLGQLRNGTTGHILDSNPHDEALAVSLRDGRLVVLDRAQIDRADIRLVSQAGFDGDLETRISVLERGTPLFMPRPRKYPNELIERGIRLVFESGRPIAHVAADLGLPAETLRKRVRRAEVDSGRGQGLTSEEREEIRKLRKENSELRRANEILRSASLFFARELDPDRPK
jgi:conjugative relaxase-like TrwC/TraI family protein